MSICGVGTDIERISRFEPSEQFERLVNRVFTSGEAAYCEGHAGASRHFAARFAAKEATVKALCRVLPKLLVTQVEIYKEDGSPAPLVRLINGAALPDGLVLHVSLSHNAEYATAFVVAEWS